MKNGVLPFIIILSLVLGLIKIHFEYYHFVFPIVLIFLLWKYGLTRRKSQVSTIISIAFIVLNLLILIIPDTVLYRIVNGDKYYWDKKKLTVDHFRGSVEVDSEHTAVVFPSIVGKISRVYNFPSAIILTADINAESWIKKEKFRKDEKGQKALEKLILHEKKHLDLTEIYCRKAKDSINSLKFPSYSKKYKIVEHFFKVSDSINDVFDLQTGNGSKKQQTILWNERINKELNDN